MEAPPLKTLTTQTQTQTVTNTFNKKLHIAHNLNPDKNTSADKKNKRKVNPEEEGKFATEESSDEKTSSYNRLLKRVQTEQKALESKKKSKKLHRVEQPILNTEQSKPVQVQVREQMSRKLLTQGDQVLFKLIQQEIGPSIQQTINRQQSQLNETKNSKKTSSYPKIPKPPKQKQPQKDNKQVQIKQPTFYIHYRNDFQAIKQHERRYMQKVRMKRPKQQSPMVIHKQSFTLKALQDEQQRQAALSKLERRRQYSQKVLSKLKRSPPQKQDSTEKKIKLDQQQHPSKYFKLQKLKNLTPQQIFQQQHAQHIQEVVAKQIGNQYLRQLRKKLKSLPPSKTNKQVSVNEQSFCNSNRYTNYLPSLHLDRYKRISQQKKNTDVLKDKADDLYQKLISKIKVYVDQRKEGLGYLEKCPIQTDIDQTMIKAVRARLAAAQKL